MNTLDEQAQITRTRLIVGGAVIIIGFLCPLLIPLLAYTDWSMGLKGVISGLLALGIPEIFMLIGVAILGKSGYSYFKEKIVRFVRQFAPPDSVSDRRYRIGLVMFCLPLLFGWMGPYLAYLITSLTELPLWSYILGDLVFIMSFFVLGGNFWDKLNGLFDNNVQVVKQSHQ